MNREAVMRQYDVREDQEIERPKYWLNPITGMQ